MPFVHVGKTWRQRILLLKCFILNLWQIVVALQAKLFERYSADSEDNYCDFPEHV